MKENDFYTNTEASGKKDFLKRIRGILVLAIVLTGFCSLVCAGGLIFEIQEASGGGGRMDIVAKVMLICAAMIILFVSLIKIAIDKNPFSRTLTLGIRIIGILFSAGAIVIPRLSGFQSSGFDIFSWGRFVFIDGAFFLPGLLMIILGRIIMAGFEMQKEMDEIL